MFFTWKAEIENLREQINSHHSFKERNKMNMKNVNFMNLNS